MYKIKIEDGSIKIKNKYILENINLEFESGKTYGLYGRNGSGKTVLMKSIIGLMKLTEGKVICNDKIIGKDSDFIPDAGILIEEPTFYGQYSAVTNLKLLAGIRKNIPVSEIKKDIETIGLDPKDYKKINKCRIYKKKIQRIDEDKKKNPRKHRLNEATSALDEDGVKWFRSFMLEQKKKNKLIIISSHIREDIELLCDEVISLEHGRVVGHKTY